MDLERENVEEKMYVAVSKDMVENKSLLTWAWENSGGRQLCTLHVHGFFHGGFHEEVLDSDPLYYHPSIQFSIEKDNDQLSTAIDDHHLNISHNCPVRIEKLFIAASSIEEGIIQLVKRHCIRNLVIGAGEQKRHSSKFSLESTKGIHVKEKAPAYCNIWFVSNDRLVDTRSTDSNNASVSKSVSLRESSSTRRFSWSSLVMKAEKPQPVNSVESSKRQVAENKALADAVAQAEKAEKLYKEELRLRKAKEEDLKKASDELSIIVAQKCSLEDLLEESNFSLEVSEKKLLSAAELWEKFKNEHDEMHTKMTDEAERAERLHKAEIKLREAKEEELKKTSKKLSVIVAQKGSLEDQLEESNFSLTEAGKKLISAAELLQKYKTEHDEMHTKMNNALEEAENLRKQLAEGTSRSNIPLFSSVFTMSDLEEATNDFDPCLKVGEGGYGNIYKGFLHHTDVAIKILHNNSTQGPREFIQEVEVLSKMRHPNLVALVGACPETWALVYEYLPGGNLEDRLTCKDNALPLSWQTRIRIATELCSALIFLHSSPLGCIIHGDLKPSNILLDDNCVCKLSDFGICRVASKNKTTMDQTTMIFTNELKGTIMYMDPVFLSTGELTRKSDVYSFGVILLRLLTGKSALGIARNVKFALSKGTLDSMLDPTAGDWPFVQAEQLARMALRCCEMSRKNRPDLGSDVWKILAPMKSSCQGLSIHRLVSDNQVPNYFICPIIQEIMEDPQIASDGFTYEAGAIRGWLNSGHDTSPMTNVTLASYNLTPNRALRSAIQEWLQLNRIQKTRSEEKIKVMEDDKVYVAVGKEMKERRSTLGWVLTKSRGRNISAVHVHVPAEIFTLPDGSEVPVTSLSDTEQEEFRECERREVQRILDDCTQMCASFQVSSENIYIEKESITQGILELISQLKIKILVMGAAKNNRYTRRMVTPMSRKAKFVLRYAPDYCRIWFICKNQLVCTREVFLQPTVDSEEMLSTLMHNINKLDRLSKIKLSPHLPICSPKVEFARGSCRPSFIKGLAHLSLALSGRLYNKEFDSKKTMVEKLAKGKEEIENIKRLWKVVSPELHKSLDKQLLLETRVATYSAEVKELEQKTISAMYMLQKFKNKRDKYEMERNKALQENKELKKLVARGPSCSQFSYSELLKATNDFDPTLIIEKGGYWCTYKGSLGRTEVAIKMLNSSSTLGPREFDREVAILSKLRHPRIVVLIGVCPEPCALVYEYLSGGSLEDRLLRKNNSPPLKWQTRIQIAKDIYSALIFIHSCLPSCSIIHGNLKTSNVLLDDNFSAKLSNFGICHVISGSDSSTSLDIGPGIISTELTPKYDVYSFGIILFHLLTGINTVGVATEVKYALLSDGLSSILDSSAGVWPLVQAQKIAHLALQCTDLNPGNRPDLESEVWNVLRPGKVSLCGLSTLKPAYEQAPHHFKCPISMDIMENPHIASDGYTYDEKEIKKWFEGDHNTSPMTGLPLENLSLIPNHSLRSAIQDWLQHTQIV